ncbi:MAG: hypothetical protein MZV63_07070 [Marinilabiliales bacterium]|nr:hypothetical protein [Marinilabiliales bacterium]
MVVNFLFLLAMMPEYKTAMKYKLEGKMIEYGLSNLKSNPMGTGHAKNGKILQGRDQITGGLIWGLSLTLPNRNIRPSQWGTRRLTMRKLARHRHEDAADLYAVKWEAYQRYIKDDDRLIDELRAEIAETIDRGKTYAVRSSANIEDSHGPLVRRAVQVRAARAGRGRCPAGSLVGLVVGADRQR